MAADDREGAVEHGSRATQIGKLEHVEHQRVDRVLEAKPWTGVVKRIPSGSWQAAELGERSLVRGRGTLGICDVATSALSPMPDGAVR